MRIARTSLSWLAFALIGCQSHPMTDYRPADQAGIWSSAIEDLKKLNTSDAEVAQAIRLKQAGVTDDTIVALVRIAHEHQHLFVATDSVKSLVGARFSEPQVLEIAQTDQLDTIGGEAVMLRLVGLSDSTVQLLLARRLKGLPTMSSGVIADLKNSGLTEREIVARIQNGMTEAQAEAEASTRQKALAHYKTGFTRIHGRKR